MSLVIGLIGPIGTDFSIFTEKLKHEEPTCLIHRLSDNKIEHINQVKSIITRFTRSDWTTTRIECIMDIKYQEEVQIFRKRSFCILINVNTSFYKRFKYLNEQNTISMNDFVQQDNAGYGDHKNIHNQTNCYFSNDNNIDLQFYRNVRRPSWDLYFMQIVILTSYRSNCMKRRVGALLVNNNRIVATGYNGTPVNMTNCNEGGCERCNIGNRDQDCCLCIHAEENVLLEVGIKNAKGCVMYTNIFPCILCTKIICQSQIKEIIYTESYNEESDIKVKNILSSVGITYRQISQYVVG